MNTTEYIKYTITVQAEEQKEILIALLTEWGIEGFEELDGVLLGSGKTSLIEDDLIDNYLQENDIIYSKSIVKNENWNALWESNFKPVQVGDFVGIRADFHNSFEGVLHEIVITPKMSFGTGHHATTFMMMELMQNLPFQQKIVLDFGTGTGILSILAEKLGAARILGIDNDDWSIDNALENLLKNDCKNVQIKKTTIATITEEFDCILANINKNVILEYFEIFNRNLKKNGKLLLSGLLVADAEDILQEAAKFDFFLLKMTEKAGWIAISLEK